MCTQYLYNQEFDKSFTKLLKLYTKASHSDHSNWRKHLSICAITVMHGRCSKTNDL